MTELIDFIEAYKEHRDVEKLMSSDMVLSNIEAAKSYLDQLPEDENENTRAIIHEILLLT